MPTTTFERPTPDQRPSDDELYRIVHGAPMNVGAPEEPDIIEYNHPAANWSTTREERARAAQAWKDEGQVDFPDNAAKSLERTEAMLRFRIKHMGEEELPIVVPDTVASYSDRLPKIQLGALARKEADWVNEETGQYDSITPTEAPEESKPQPEQPEYIGRHRRRGMRIPLHRLIRHHKPRHAA